jgi:hypothetical protein
VPARCAAATSVCCAQCTRTLIDAADHRIDTAARLRERGIVTELALDDERAPACEITDSCAVLWRAHRGRPREESDALALLLQRRDHVPAQPACRADHEYSVDVHRAPP